MIGKAGLLIVFIYEGKNYNGTLKKTIRAMNVVEGMVLAH